MTKRRNPGLTIILWGNSVQTGFQLKVGLRFIKDSQLSNKLMTNDPV